MQKKALAEGQSPPQELEVSPRSGLYLLVIVMIVMIVMILMIVMTVMTVMIVLENIGMRMVRNGNGYDHDDSKIAVKVRALQMYQNKDL